MAHTMERGRVQSLFRYMPGQTFNWDGGLGSFRGTDIDAEPLDIPEGWLKRPLLRLLNGFGEDSPDSGAATTWRGREIITRGDYRLLEPRRFHAEFFPRVFFCPECGRVLYNVDDRPDRVTCRSCRTKMQQLAFVEYHQCGHLSGLQPPRCAHGCRESMRLVGPDGSPRSSADRRISEWRWRCSRCNVEAGRGVYRGCPTCRRGQIRVAPADAGPVYYPQSITVINPPRGEDWAILSDQNVYKAAVAQALGLLPPGIEGLRQAINDTDSPTSRELIREQTIALYNLDLSKSDDRALLDTLMARTDSQQDESGDTDEPHWQERIEDLGLQDEDIEEIGSECIELTLALDEGDPARPKRTVTIADLIDEQDGSPLAAIYATRYQDALQRHGVRNVTLIKEFPLARVVAGYTREDSNPRSQQGLTFHFFEGDGGRKAMYGQRTITEALLVEVDPERIVRWLNSCSSTRPEGRGTLGEPLESEEPRAWMFRNLAPASNVFEEPGDILTSAVLGLLHSMSHRFIRALTERSGLKADSITERILPYNGAFLVYPEGRSDFTLGGLEHVFRHYLDEAIDFAAEEGRCVFDPPCRARGGACAVCMHLSEVSCERFNTALSRHYLFGGTSRGVRWSAFWDG